METNNGNINIGQCFVLGDIQEAFSKKYPFLKIDFFEIDKVTNTAKSSFLDINTKLTKLTSQDELTGINMGHNRTVAELAEDFFNMLGLVAEISRKSGKVWSVTKLTDSWTLETQNSAAEFICSLM
ncbi:MAG: hypothetical protein H7X88_08010 [Gloeobacteraceae cyanobacterium ES-bin-316]|nr:hypothetical protein [Ferruginibacter sp.]